MRPIAAIQVRQHPAMTANLSLDEECRLVSRRHSDIGTMLELSIKPARFFSRASLHLLVVLSIYRALYADLNKDWCVNTKGLGKCA